MKQLLLVAGVGFSMVALAYTSQPSGTSRTDVEEFVITDTVPKKDTTKKKNKKGKSDTLRRDTSRWPTDTSLLRL